jgi:hypothetical protein
MSSLQFGLPEAVEVAVLVDCEGLATTGANLCHGFILEVDADATILKLNIHEGDVVFGKHRVLHAAHFDADFAVVNLLHHGEVFLLACLYGAGDEFGHFLAAAEGGYAAVNGFDDNITTVVAFEKSGCHSCIVFVVNDLVCLVLQR